MADLKTGVLLGQVGTPPAPTRKAVRAYLRNFLSDARVIDLHPFIWKPILYGIVLPIRSVTSAKMYEEIWTSEGSPLLAHSRKVVKGVQERLGSQYNVKLGMAYGEPDIRKAVSELEADGIQKMITVPLFPQFSTATTASVFDEVYSAVSGRSWGRRHITKKSMPALEFKGPYYDDPELIRILASHIRSQVSSLPNAPDKYILTFHGLPRRYVESGDPYQAQCARTAERIAAEMGWAQDEWTVAYQSRFGREEWLQPYAEPLIRGLSKNGVERPCIIPLSFVTDCLETVHELGILYRGVFAEGGGDAAHYSLLPCMNENPEWLDFLASLIRGD